jgi:lysozyme
VTIEEEAMSILGTNSIIDISQHQGHPNFRTIKDAGIVGVIHKATEGVGFHDAVYAANKQAAKAEGLLWGAYHFGTGSDPVKQAEEFVQVAGVADDELLVLDYEDNNHGTQMKIPGARSFVKRVFELTGRHPGLYSGNTIKEDLGDTADPDFANCWLWVAHYDDAPRAPKIQKTWSKWTLWQYTDGNLGPQPHAINGVGGCDRDTFNGDAAALKAFWTSGGRALPA